MTKMEEQLIEQQIDRLLARSINCIGFCTETIRVVNGLPNPNTLGRLLSGTSSDRHMDQCVALKRSIATLEHELDTLKSRLTTLVQVHNDEDNGDDSDDNCPTKKRKLGAEPGPLKLPVSPASIADTSDPSSQDSHDTTSPDPNSLDTAELAAHVKRLLDMHELPNAYAEFATKVLDISEAYFAQLLAGPAPWSRLDEAQRALYRKMHKWTLTVSEATIQSIKSKVVAAAVVVGKQPKGVKAVVKQPLDDKYKKSLRTDVVVARVHKLLDEHNITTSMLAKNLRIPLAVLERISKQQPAWEKLRSDPAREALHKIYEWSLNEDAIQALALASTK